MAKKKHQDTQPAGIPPEQTQAYWDQMALNNAASAAAEAPNTAALLEQQAELDRIQALKDYRERNAKNIIDSQLYGSSTNDFTKGATEFDEWYKESYMPQVYAGFYQSYDPNDLNSPIQGQFNFADARRQFANRADFARAPNRMQSATGRWSWWD